MVTTLSGSAAMAQKFRDMEERIKKMEKDTKHDDPVLADLQIFTEYDYLMDRTMSKNLSNG